MRSAPAVEPSGDTFWWSVVWVLLKTAAQGLWWLVRRPLLLGVVLVAAAVGVAPGGWRRDALLALAILGWVLLVGLVVARLVFPVWFTRWISGPAGRVRVRRRYRRRWSAAVDLCGLVKTRDQVLIAPELLRVRPGNVADRLLVEMIMGQALTDWERACPVLAASLGAVSARVWTERPGRLWLQLIRGDALAEPVPALPIPADPDLRQVQVGVREDGRPWQLGALGTHVFIGGVTGSGKGSVIWSLLRGLAQPITAGVVAVWAVDPKGGMELGFGRPLFTRFAAGSTTAMVELLEEAVTVMDARCQRLAGRVRAHTPTLAEPMLLIVVDELSTLTAYEADSKLRARATGAISALLARGRAAAVVVIAAAQDPRKEVVTFRSLFPTKVALRLDTPTQVDMVLGEGMHQMGAAADRIPAGCPGVGYVAVEGVREPVRVRAAWVSDTDIHTMTTTYPAPDHYTTASTAGKLGAPEAVAAAEPVAAQRVQSSRGASGSGGRR